MTKPPGKRGSGRKTPRSAGSDKAQGKPGNAPRARRAAPSVPGWMPGPDPRRAPSRHGASSSPHAPRGEMRDPHAAREAQRYEQPIASREMIK